jgi:hypothetical protein
MAWNSVRLAVGMRRLADTTGRPPVANRKAFGIADDGGSARAPTSPLGSMSKAALDAEIAMWSAIDAAPVSGSIASRFQPTVV